MIVGHFPMHCRGGLASCGYKLPDESKGVEALQVVEQASNVVAVLCGHTHWNEYTSRETQEWAEG